MPTLRHYTNISAHLSIVFCAATFSISAITSTVQAQEHKSVAMVGDSPESVASKKSVTSSTRALDAKGIYPRSHWEKAYYFKQKHDLNNALIEFLKSTQENPRLVRGFYEQALIFRDRGYLKLAESSLEQALAAKPDYQDARILLATIRIQQGNVGGAVKELTKSLGLDISSPEKTVLPHHILSPEAAKVIEKVSGNVTESAKKTNDLVDAIPTLVLQSIHPSIKNTSRSDLSEKNTEEKVVEHKSDSHRDDSNSAGESESPVISAAIKAATLTPTSKESFDENTSRQPEPNIVDTLTKRLDLSAIKDSLENAVKAPLAISNYLSHLSIPNFWPVNIISPEVHEKTDGTIPTTDVLPGSGNPSESAKTDNSVDTQKENRKRHRKVKKHRLSKQNVEIATENDSADSKTIVGESSGKETKVADVAEGSNIIAELPDFVQKAIANHNEAVQTEASTKVTEAAHTQLQSSEQLSSPELNAGQSDSINKPELQQQTTDSNTIFSPSNFSQSTKSILKSMGERKNSSETADTADKTTASSPSSAAANQTATAKLDSDEWATKLLYLVEHGTNSLKEGEAFMFAEDSGEASLFLADGRVIRRIVQAPRDQQAIVRERRPDMLIPEDLLYKLSLLGKLMPKPESANTQISDSASGTLDKSSNISSASSADNSQNTQEPKTFTAGGTATTPHPIAEGGFNVQNLMGNSENFWGWLKTVFKF